MKLAEPTTEIREEFAAKAKAIYNNKFKEELEKTSKGQVAAIEVEHEECFVGKDIREAYYKAKIKHFDKYFFFIKIGYAGFKKRRR